MTYLHWKVQAAIYGVLARYIPTCFLQDEMSTRRGVVSTKVPLGESITETATGPCVLIVNSD